MAFRKPLPEEQRQLAAVEAAPVEAAPVDEATAAVGGTVAGAYDPTAAMRLTYDPEAYLESIGISRFADEEGMDSLGYIGGRGDEEGFRPWEDKAQTRQYGFLNRALANQRTYEDVLSQGQLPQGWVPKYDNIPTFEEWFAAQGPDFLTTETGGIRGPGRPIGRVATTAGNDPYYQYFQTFYQLPTNRGDFFTNLPIMLGTGVAGLAAGGMLAPYLAGAAPGAATAASPWIAGATAGGLQGGMGTLQAGGDISDALRAAATGAAAGGLGGAAAGQVSGMIENPWVSPVLAGAARGAVAAPFYGANPFEAALQGGLAGLGTQAVGQLSDADFEALSNELANMEVVEPTPGMLPTAPEQIMMMTPQNAAMLSQMMEQSALAMPAPTIEQFAAQASPELQTILSGMGVEPAPLPSVSDADFEAAATEEALTGEPLPEQPTGPTAEQTKYIDWAKQALKAYQQLTGAAGGGAPEFQLPPREEGTTDDEYRQIVSEEALSYLGLDPDAMRAAGYEPGTQEYLDYILAQADTVIQAAFGNDPEALLAGESVEGLQQALRGKTEEEMESLQRALYVRGALGTMSFRSSAIDPFTGRLEYLGAGGATESDTAAAQRGYARLLEDAARLSGPESRMAIRGMLGRDVDLFGLEQARKQRTLDDMLRSFTEGTDEDEEFDQYERRYGRAGRRVAPRPVETSSFWNQFGRRS